VNYRKLALKRLRRGMGHGRYVGRDNALRGATALLRQGAGALLAQFDDIQRFPVLAYGWHSFKPSEFKLRP
jgi:hypothetical protein